MLVARESSPPEKRDCVTGSSDETNRDRVTSSSDETNQRKTNPKCHISDLGANEKREITVREAINGKRMFTFGHWSFCHHYHQNYHCNLNHHHRYILAVQSESLLVPTPPPASIRVTNVWNVNLQLCELGAIGKIEDNEQQNQNCPLPSALKGFDLLQQQLNGKR